MHIHYWIIQTANGATSPGVCQTCGEEGTFDNYFESDQGRRAPEKSKQEKVAQREVAAGRKKWDRAQKTVFLKEKKK